VKRVDVYMPRIIRKEGGYVNHPDDPGGATNRGVTIGTLKRLRIDKDGDGDSDIVDLKLLTEADAVRVFTKFYAEPVQADMLPFGLDFAVVDFSVNSGPVTAVQKLQTVLGVAADGHMGPKTLAAIAKRDIVELINAYCDTRLAYMKRLKNKKTGKLLWDSFGKGWTARVQAVRADAIRDATSQIPAQPEKPKGLIPPAREAKKCQLQPLWNFIWRKK